MPRAFPREIASVFQTAFDQAQSYGQRLAVGHPPHEWMLQARSDHPRQIPVAVDEYLEQSALKESLQRLHPVLAGDPMFHVKHRFDRRDFPWTTRPRPIPRRKSLLPLHRLPRLPAPSDLDSYGFSLSWERPNHARSSTCDSSVRAVRAQNLPVLWCLIADQGREHRGGALLLPLDSHSAPGGSGHRALYPNLLAVESYAVIRSAPPC